MQTIYLLIEMHGKAVRTTTTTLFFFVGDPPPARPPSPLSGGLAASLVPRPHTEKALLRWRC